MTIPRRHRHRIPLATAVAITVLPMSPTADVPVWAGTGAPDCGGVVFDDRDRDGTRRENPADGDDDEPGVSGARIEVADADGSSASATSDADGAWEFDADALSFPVRIRITPPEGWAVSRTGPSSGTTVRFLDRREECADAQSLWLGVHDPERCSPTPEIVTSCFVVGNAPEHDDTTAVLAVAESAVDNGSTTATSAEEWMSPVYRQLATTGEVGTVYGQAVDSNGVVYAASFVKRHTRSTSSLNPDGNPTVVYRIPPGRPPSVLTVVDPTATNPHGEPPVDALVDTEVMEHVYASGLGDLEVSPDGTRLFTIDLRRRLLVEIDTGDGDIVTTTPIDGAALGIDDCAVGPANPFGDLRAFGLGWGPSEELLVGVVCSAESTVAEDLPIDESAGIGQPAGDHDRLIGFVYAYSDATGFTQRLRWPLAGDRGNTQNNGLVSNDAAWHPWVPAYPFVLEYERVSYPQPAVTDVAVAGDGSLIIGLGDRWGHQTAPNSEAPNIAGGLSRVSEPVIAGDLQRACPAETGWIIEGTGACPGGFGNFVEYFGGERYGWHDETALGSIAVLPGGDEVVTNQMDPIPADDTWQSGGLAWHPTSGGEALKGLRLYDGRNAMPDATFEKASGIGDVELSCGAGPIEIGGMVWRDRDTDGVQDPGETRLGSVPVELRHSDDGPVATTRTDADGRYWFSDRDTDLVAGETYTITIVDEPGSSAAGMQPTTTGGASDRELDSDARMLGETGETRIGAVVIAGDDPATPAREGVDHAIDLGLVDRYDLALEIAESPERADRGRIRLDIDVRNEGSEPAGAFEVAADAPAGTTIVGASGVTGIIARDGDRATWTFDGSEPLPPGGTRRLEMTVGIVETDRTEFVALAEITADDGDDADSTPANAGARSDAGSESPLEDDEALVDVRRYGLRGLVWNDVDRSGSFDEDGSETGLAEVAIALVDERDSLVAQTETSATGIYEFDLLQAGTYRVRVEPATFVGDPTLADFDLATGDAVADDDGAFDRDDGFRSAPIVVGDGSSSWVDVDIGFSIRSRTSFVRDVLPRLAIIGVVAATMIILLVQRRSNRPGRPA